MKRSSLQKKDTCRISQVELKRMEKDILSAINTLLYLSTRLNKRSQLAAVNHDKLIEIPDYEFLENKRALDCVKKVALLRQFIDKNGYKAAMAVKSIMLRKLFSRYLLGEKKDSLIQKIHLNNWVNLVLFDPEARDGNLLKITHSLVPATNKSMKRDVNAVKNRLSILTKKSIRSLGGRKKTADYVIEALGISRASIQRYRRYFVNSWIDAGEPQIFEHDLLLNWLSHHERFFSKATFSFVKKRIKQRAFERSPNEFRWYVRELLAQLGTFDARMDSAERGGEYT